MIRVEDAAVDHIVTNVYLGEMNYWVRWFEEVMGFRNLLAFTDKDISTEYSALMSKVMENGTGKCKFPINEPAEGKKKSQIEEFLDYYRGQGVQHIAMSTGNIYETVTELRRRDIDFLRVPSTYYAHMRERVGDVGEDWDKLEELGTGPGPLFTLTFAFTPQVRLRHPAYGRGRPERVEYRPPPPFRASTHEPSFF